VAVLYSSSLPSLSNQPIMLEAQGKHYNHLSDQLRKELNDKADKAGRYVRYKFDIARKNPDGEQRTGGEFLYPLLYTLTPATYNIVDPYDKKQKKIALVLALKEFGADFDHFGRVTIRSATQGKLILDMTKPEDRDIFGFLEMHPKMTGGRFQDKEGPGIVSLIDEVKTADDSLKRRNLRIDAMYVAANMQLREIKDFAAAMGWDEHEEPVLLRDKITELAEMDPEFFRSFIDNKSIEYRATIQRSLDNDLIQFLPVESKFIWSTNRQTIAVLDRVEGHNVLERMTDWIMTSKNGMEVFTKLKSMLSKKGEPTT